MYSPAARPSRTRAAPAKNRIWSTIGGISSAAVTAIGLPVFSLSRAISSSAFASTTSAIRSRAACRSDGVVLAPGVERIGRGAVGAVDVLRIGHRRLGEHLARCGVDQLGGLAGDGIDGLAVDEVADDAGHWALLRIRTAATRPPDGAECSRAGGGPAGSEQPNPSVSWRSATLFAESVRIPTVSLALQRSSDGSMTPMSQSSATGAGPARRHREGDHRAAPAGRPASLRRDRQGRRPVRGRGAPAGRSACSSPASCRSSPSPTRCRSGSRARR